MKLISITFLIVALALFSAEANDFYTKEQALKATQSALKEKGITIKEQIEITKWLEKTAPLTLYSCERVSGEPFYVAFTHSKGRYEYFDYMVVITTNFEVEKVKVLKYRSENGGEISSKKWLEQFIGYTTGYLHYKRDISAISGATISAMSISRDIPKVMEVVRANAQSKV